MRAPRSAISYIIKAFGGIEESGDTGISIVYLQGKEDAKSVISLVEMLNGWDAYKHPNILRAVHIQRVI